MKSWILPALALGTLFETSAGFLEDWAKLRAMQPEGYVATRAAETLKIDGKLDEESWKAANWTREFQDIEGGTKPAPRFRTQAKMLWDDDYFYFAAWMEEPHVWGTLTKHDSVIFHDPDFEIFIDPDGDRHNYYEFEMNALNTGWDLILKKPYIDGGPAQNEWEIPGLKTAVSSKGTLNDPSDTDEGWSVEIAIPWAVLGEFSNQETPPKEGDVWRVDFSRVEWEIQIESGRYVKTPGKREDNWVWSPTGLIDMHRPENWGYVKFANSSEESFKPRRSPAADLLLEVYYRQKDFQAKNQRFAKSIRELAGGVIQPSMQKVQLRGTAEGYQASFGGMHIRQDGLLWSGGASE